MKLSQATTKMMFADEHRFAGAFMRSRKYPWQAVYDIESFFDDTTHLAKYDQISPKVWAEKGAIIEDLSCVEGRLIVGAGTVIKKNAILRGDNIIGRDCIIGYFVELKNSILFDTVHIPHLSYVGESILGNRTHLGAGVKLSNFKSTADRINIIFEDGRHSTGMLKLGAICGDGVELGCNSVLSPGTVIGSDTTVYPLVCVRGAVDGGRIVKSVDMIIRKK